MPKLPDSIQRFVDRSPLLTAEQGSAIGGLSSYHGPGYRAASAMLLSGRIGACKRDWPRKVDIDRLVKGTNVDPYFVVRAGAFLKVAEVLAVDKGVYCAGPNFAEFWGDDPAAVYDIARRAVVRWIDLHSPYNMFRQFTSGPQLLDLLALYFACHRGRALSAGLLHREIGAFARVPNWDLETVAKRLNLDIGDLLYWRQDYQDKATQAVKLAIGMSGWVASDGATFNPIAAISPLGLEMLGLEPLSPFPPLDTRLVAQSDRSIFIGAGRPIDELAILFRSCKPVGIDHVLEFKVDARRLRQLTLAEVDELKALLAEVELPSTIAAMFDAKPRPVNQAPSPVEPAFISDIAS